MARFVVTLYDPNAQPPFTKEYEHPIEAGSEWEAADALREWLGEVDRNRVRIKDIHVVVLGSPFEDPASKCSNCARPGAYYSEGVSSYCVTCASLLK